MKKLLILILLGIFVQNLHSQEITGTWNGALEVQGMKLRLVFYIQNNGESYQATMDSPDQGANGIPVTSVSFENKVLKLEIANLGIKYEGNFQDENTIDGTFNQVGQVFDLKLSKGDASGAIQQKNLEPEPPFPYKVEEVNFENKVDHIYLAGTLTCPKEGTKFPAVVLISGSGPQNRDEEVMGHKPFLVIADYLTRHGIAVLRFDDRGTGQSEGDFKSATSFDFSHDVEAALEYLKTRNEIDSKNIGLIGHSEGGLIAPMVASRNTEVKFIVLLAGPGIRGEQLLLMQQELIGKAMGVSAIELEEAQDINKKAFGIIIGNPDREKAVQELKTYLTQAIENNPDALKTAGVSTETFIQQQMKQITSPWMVYFLNYNPAPALEQTHCAVLAVNGAKDLQVPAKENLEAIAQALTKGGNTNFITKEFPDLNHLFQHCETGLPQEYAGIQETFSANVLQFVTQWIKDKTE